MFRKAIAIAPKHERAWVNLGMALAQQGRAKDAVAAFSKILRPAEAQYNVAVILAQNGNRKAAEKMLNATLAAEPNLAPAKGLAAALQNSSEERNKQFAASASTAESDIHPVVHVEDP